MFKYIGIRGHRGAGKNTISYLIGNAIAYYEDKKSWDGFEDWYKESVDEVLADDLKCPADNIYLESFFDTANVMVSYMIGVPIEYLYEDWTKDSIIVDLKTFDIHMCKDKLDLEIFKDNNCVYSAKDLEVVKRMYGFETKELEHIYCTLREFVVYFSKYVMQKSFGASVWVKSIKADTEFRCKASGHGDGYKIFTDCKFPSELDYIKSNNGIIVKVVRENNAKEETIISKELKNDDRFDFEINLDGDLMKPEIIEQIKCITSKIVEQ